MGRGGSRRTARAAWDALAREARETEDAVDPDVGDARANARDFGIVGGEGDVLSRQRVVVPVFTKDLDAVGGEADTARSNASTCDVTDRSRRVLRPWCRAGRCR